MPDINKFIVNSRLPIEKIAWLTETTKTTAGTDYESITLTNPTGKPLLIQGEFTTDNWTNATPIESQAPDGSELTNIWSNASTINVQIPPNGAKTYKIRLWGFTRESDEGAQAEATAEQSAQPLAFDSRNNYLKPAIEGTVQFGANTEGAYLDVPHSLGFRPYAEIWRTSATGATLYAGAGVICPDAQKIRIYNTLASSGAIYYFYRIHANEI